MANRTPPKRLYKYRAFSDRTLGMLVDDTLYFADPATFNDPLDTKPTLASDLPNAELQHVLAKLIEERTEATMSAAAKAIHYRGPKTIEHIARQSRKAAEQLLADVRYNATNLDFDHENPEGFLLASHIESELLRRYNRGVVSLAERAECPLMWSHYGDQHRGLCLGYSVPRETSDDIHKIKYGGSRLVKASEVNAMLDGDKDTQKRVDEAVLLKKAQDWRYEKEWRLIGLRGEQRSILELEEVVFGMRCPPAVVYGVVKALSDRDRKVRFYEIRGQHGRFLLDKRAADIDKLLASRPRRNLRYDEMFDDLDAGQA